TTRGPLLAEMCARTRPASGWSSTRQRAGNGHTWRSANYDARPAAGGDVRANPAGQWVVIDAAARRKRTYV
ncbi:hypothetical protein CJ738_36555, partial [Klebsiella pneumoniae]